MNGSSAVDVEYVQRDIFDEKLRNIDDRATFDRERTDDKFDRLQAIMEKNFALLNAKIDHNNELFEAKIDKLNEKIDKVEETLSISIMGLADRLDDMKDYQNRWFTILTALGGVLTLVFAAFEFFK